MIELNKVLIEEANRLSSNISMCENKLDNMNKGTIFIRKIRHTSFVYRKFKKHGQVYSVYLGPLKSDNAQKGIQEAKEYKKVKAELKEYKKSFEDIKKSIWLLNHKKPNFYNNKIKLEFELSAKMKKMIKKTEEADLLNDYGSYMNWACAIDAQAKKETTHHIITESQWNKIVARYCL